MASSTNKTTTSFLFKEVSKHNQTQDCWLIIHGKVYDVTSFMDDHPGGEEVLLAATGKDATDDYEDVGHTEEATHMMQKYCIGEVQDPENVPRKLPNATPADNNNAFNHMTAFPPVKQLLLPLLLLGLGVGFAVTKA